MWYRYIFNKLVRSFVTEEENGKRLVVSYKILNDKEYKKELINKFHEEALEVIDAKDKSELIEEIGDCYEVIDEILRVNNISKDEVLRVQKAKKDRKGGFEKRIFLNTIHYDDQNPLHQEPINYVRGKNQDEKYILSGEYDSLIVDFIITNQTRDKIYIQKRSSTRKSYSNTWELAGGMMEMNEVFKTCIKRELKEELNLELLQINDLIHESECVINNKKCGYSVFYIEVLGWDNFKLEEGKADEFKWICKDEIEILNIKREDGKISPVYEAVVKFFDLQSNVSLYESN